MSISEIFIRKPIMTVLVMVVVSAFGISAYLQLPVSSLPNVDYPVMTISAYYPGASPATMASTVATPLENECMQINGIQSIISESSSGQTEIQLTFDLGRNTDQIAPDIQAAIARAQNNLPPDLPIPPTYSKNNPAEKPIMYLLATSDVLTPGELYDHANRLVRKRINIIEGVSKIQIWGAKPAVRIAVDPHKLAAFNLGLGDVSAALSAGTVSIPGGSLNGRYRTFSIEPRGQLRKADDYRNLVLAYRNGAPIRLGEVATCLNSLDNDLIDVCCGKPGGNVFPQSICMAISRQSGANTVALARAIRSKLDAIRDELPQSVRLEVLHDGSEAIKESIDDVQMTILIAVALVVLIIFCFVGRVRETLIPCMVLPVALLGTCIAMRASNFNLDTLSLMALVLAVGFLVDDAIVVLENTVRHIESGTSPVQAAIKSMKEITFTVISTSVALVIVFVPLVFMSGVVGRNFREFALTVIYSIAVSTLLAITLTPMMCARMLKPLGARLNRFQRAIEAGMAAVIERYGRLLHWTLRRKFLSVLMWLLCICGSAALVALLPKSFVPTGDSGVLFGLMVMPQGASTEQMREFQSRINQTILANPAVTNLVTITGHTLGADKSTGYVIVRLKPPRSRKPIEQVQKEIEAACFAFPHGFVFLNPLPVLKLSAGGEATAAGDKYSYTMTGNDRDELYEAAGKLEHRMRTLKGFTGIQTSVKLNMPQLDVEIDRDRASSLGLNAKDIETALALGFSQGRVTTFTTDNDQYDVIVELAKNDQRAPENLASIRLRSGSTGRLVPLGTVASWKETVGPQTVPHSQQMDAATISFNLEPDITLGEAAKALEQAAAEVLPPSVKGALKGEAQEFEEAIASLAVLMLVAIFLMYVVLGILYESYIHPFTVLTTLPVAAFGGLLTLLLFRSELSLYAYIGMFTLLGIIAKNGIIMVDFAIQRMAEGMNAFDAIHDACRVRFRPILMTGLSTIFGALPIALGYGADGSSRVPLGLIVVGGMVFAQVVTLFVTPGIFLYMDWVQKHFFDKFEFSRSGAARGDETAAEPSPAR